MPDGAALRIAVVGAGPAGLVAGRTLLQQGFHDFTIFEKAEAVGGTWHLHSYPGLACDVKAAAYTFDETSNPDWSHSFVERQEIEAYLQRCAEEFGLLPHIRFGARIVSMAYQGDGTWRLATESGEAQVFDVVISAMGNQHTPLFPALAGMEGFRGDSWHSTEWNHDVPLEGRRIAVVGSAAAAVQIVPELAKVAGHLYVLQRSPNWILPRGRKPYSGLSRALLRWKPLRDLHRGFHRRIMYLSSGAFQLGHKTQGRVEAMGRKHLESAIADRDLRDLVTPRTRFGCKRPLMSDGFYPALQQENVTLVPSAAQSVHERGLTTADGRELEVDVIVYCTGYKVMDFERIEVTGEGGRSLAKCMAEAPEAYLGMSVSGFPNYFFALGPNALCASASFFESAEVNLACITRILCEKQAAGAQSIDVRPERVRAYNDWIVRARESFSWGSGSCDSYYRTADGHTPFLFPGDFGTYREQRQAATLADYTRA